MRQLRDFPAGDTKEGQSRVRSVCGHRLGGGLPLMASMLYAHTWLTATTRVNVPLARTGIPLNNNLVSGHAR